MVHFQPRRYPILAYIVISLLLILRIVILLLLSLLGCIVLPSATLLRAISRIVITCIVRLYFVILLPFTFLPTFVVSRVIVIDWMRHEGCS